MDNPDLPAPASDTADAATSNGGAGVAPLIVPAETSTAGAGQAPQDAIAGTSTLRGLMLYGAILAFAALYVYFIIEILSAGAHKPPNFDGAMISAAAALAGVLGSAFALKVGVVPTHVNDALRQHLAATPAGTGAKVNRLIHQALSLDPGDKESNSWPLTFGIWVYAIVASAVAITYIFNQSETPGPVKALAVTFAGYVLALINAAYGLSKSNG